MLLDELQPAQRVMAQEVSWGPEHQEDLRFVLAGIAGVLAEDPALAQEIDELLDDLEAAGQLPISSNRPTPPSGSPVATAGEPSTAVPSDSAPLPNPPPTPDPAPHAPATEWTDPRVTGNVPATGDATPRRWLPWALAAGVVAELVAVLLRGMDGSGQVLPEGRPTARATPVAERTPAPATLPAPPAARTSPPASSAHTAAATPETGQPKRSRAPRKRRVTTATTLRTRVDSLTAVGDYGGALATQRALVGVLTRERASPAVLAEAYSQLAILYAGQAAPAYAIVGQRRALGFPQRAYGGRGRRGSAVLTSPWRPTTSPSVRRFYRLRTGSRRATSSASGTNPRRRVSCGVRRGARRGSSRFRPRAFSAAVGRPKGLVPEHLGLVQRRQRYRPPRQRLGLRIAELGRREVWAVDLHTDRTEELLLARR